MILSLLTVWYIIYIRHTSTSQAQAGFWTQFFQTWATQVLFFYFKYFSLFIYSTASFHWSFFLIHFKQKLQQMNWIVQKLRLQAWPLALSCPGAHQNLELDHLQPGLQYFWWGQRTDLWRTRPLRNVLKLEDCFILYLFYGRSVRSYIYVYG